MSKIQCPPGGGIAKTGIYCPICKTEAEIYMDVDEHPNSMYSIRSCSHINISRKYDEEEAIEELKYVINEIYQAIDKMKDERSNK